MSPRSNPRLDPPVSNRRHEAIGPTAHYTAYVWKQLRLPHAEHFATRRGRALYWTFFGAGEWMTRLSPRIPSMAQYLEYRHRLLDAEAEASGADILVELGAGLTRRSVTWAVDRGIRAVDIDLPEMIRARREILQRAGGAVAQAVGRSLELVEADVTEPGFWSTLQRVLEGHDRAVVIAEGLLSYLEPEDREALFAGVAQGLRTLRNGGVFLCDLHTVQDQARAGVAAHVLRTAIRVVTRRSRALDPFASREAVELSLAAAGFDGARRVIARDHEMQVPRLRHLQSPAQIYRATVERFEPRSRGEPEAG